MKQNYIYRVISQFYTHSHLPSIEEKVQKWIISDEWTTEKNDAFKIVWDTIQTIPNENTHKSLDCVKNTIGMIEDKQKKSRKISSWLNYAAIVFPIILFSGVSFYINQHLKMIEVRTSNNEQKECVLPDGTAVLLNSGSKITYPSHFKDTVRVVELEGEAYFTVTHDRKKTFIVQTRSLSVKVLGTQFNVSAYPTDDRTTATLNSGSLQVNIKRSRKDDTYILTPNQQISYNKIAKSVSVDTVENGNPGWKDGLLIFQDATFNDIMNTLQRRFNISIAYNKQKFKSELYTVRFVNNENITEIFKILQEVAEDFNYKIEGNKITIVKKEIHE